MQQSVMAEPRTSLEQSLSRFEKWLRLHPIDGDRPYAITGVQYQVARYCEYLDANPWTGGDPLRDPIARDGAVNAYRAYLAMFNTPAAIIELIVSSIGRFYGFLQQEHSRP